MYAFGNRAEGDPNSEAGDALGKGSGLKPRGSSPGNRVSVLPEPKGFD